MVRPGDAPVQGFVRQPAALWPEEQPTTVRSATPTAAEPGGVRAGRWRAWRWPGSDGGW